MSDDHREISPTNTPSITPAAPLVGRRARTAFAINAAIALSLCVTAMSCADGTDASSTTATGAPAPSTTAIEDTACFADLIESLDDYVGAVMANDGVGVRNVIFKYGSESAEYRLILRLSLDWVQNAARVGAESASMTARREVADFCADTGR